MRVLEAPCFSPCGSQIFPPTRSLPQVPLFFLSPPYFLVQFLSFSTVWDTQLSRTRYTHGKQPLSYCGVLAKETCTGGCLLLLRLAHLSALRGLPVLGQVRVSRKPGMGEP